MAPPRRGRGQGLRDRAAQAAEGRRNGDSGGHLAKPPGRSPAQQELEERVRNSGGYYDAISPSHVAGPQFAAMVIGLLHRDNDLLEASILNPMSFMAALADCAMLGLVPGRGYALVAFKNSATGVSDVTGIIEASGEAELIYRTGQVAAVVSRVVRWEDVFKRGRTETEPPKWEPVGEGFGTNEQRGPIRGVFSYAVLTGGGNSEVIYLGPSQLDRARTASKARSFPVWGNGYDSITALSAGEGTEGPDTEAMCLKTGIRRLWPVVPHSAEYLMEVMSAAARAANTPIPAGGAAPALYDIPDTAPLKMITGSAEPGTPAATEPRVTKGAVTQIIRKLEQSGVTDPEGQLRALAAITGRPVDAVTELSRSEGSAVDDRLKAVLEKAGGNPEVAQSAMVKLVTGAEQGSAG